MAVSKDLTTEILERLEVSDRTLKRAVRELIDAYGPMTGDEARGVIAAEAQIRLADYGWSEEKQERIRVLRRDGAVSRFRSVPAGPRMDATARSASPQIESDNRSEPKRSQPTRGEAFDMRQFHPLVVQRSRKAFINRMNDTAVERAIKSVNNRVKKLVATGKDGATLMTTAFSLNSPHLQLSALTTQSQRDEQLGLMKIAEGAIIGLRNPRAHDDEWPADEVDHYALDALSVASFLHRTIDRCIEYASDSST